MADNTKKHGGWQKGQSGNPGGRPKKDFSLNTALREYLAEKDNRRKKLRKDVIVEKLYKLAAAGDVKAIKMIFDRLEGLPVSQIELSGKMGGPIKIAYVKDFKGV